MTTFEDVAATALHVRAIGEAISTEPGTPELWARGHNSVLLGVDFTGREDINYHAMMNAEPLTVAEANLRFKVADANHLGFVYDMTFDKPDIEPVAVVGLAVTEAVSWFQAVEHIWLSPIASFDTEQAVLHVVAPNDPDRWRAVCPQVEPFVP